MGRGGESDVRQHAQRCKDAAAAGRTQHATVLNERQPVHSSGVDFYPPSEKYWRIGGKWYDFSKFMHRHPGGKDIMKIARDRFEDCTFAFESHHHNYAKVRAIIKKFEVPVEDVLTAGLRSRPKRGTPGLPCHFDAALDQGDAPKLLDDAAFYSVLRRKVAAHLREVGCPDGGPTTQCVALFWFNFFAWVAMFFVTLWSGSLISAMVLGFVTSWLGAFGHNWVHQPAYKRWAYLSLDSIGFSSDGWFREHVLQHHMYTNTPWDNHFKGTGEPEMRAWCCHTIVPSNCRHRRQTPS
jgi:hypothetical protein